MASQILNFLNISVCFVLLFIFCFKSSLPLNYITLSFKNVCICTCVLRLTFWILSKGFIFNYVPKVFWTCSSYLAQDISYFKVLTSHLGNLVKMEIQGQGEAHNYLFLKSYYVGFYCWSKSPCKLPFLLIALKTPERVQKTTGELWKINNSRQHGARSHLQVQWYSVFHCSSPLLRPFYILDLIQRQFQSWTTMVRTHNTHSERNLLSVQRMR